MQHMEQVNIVLNYFKYYLKETINLFSILDSPESVKRETKIFFPNFSFEEFHEKEETFYSNENYIEFDSVNFIHNIKKNV